MQGSFPAFQVSSNLSCCISVRCTVSFKYDNLKFQALSLFYSSTSYGYTRLINICAGNLLLSKNLSGIRKDFWHACPYYRFRPSS